MKKIFIILGPFLLPLFYLFLHLYPLLFPIIIFILIIFTLKNFQKSKLNFKKNLRFYYISILTIIILQFISLSYINYESKLLEAFFQPQKSPHPYFTTKSIPKIYASSDFFFPLYLSPNFNYLNLVKLDLSYDPQYLSLIDFSNQNTHHIQYLSSKYSPTDNLVSLIIAPEKKSFSSPQDKLVSLHFKALIPGTTKINLLSSSKTFPATPQPRNSYFFPPLSFNLQIYPPSSTPIPTQKTNEVYLFPFYSKENQTINTTIPVRLIFFTNLAKLNQIILSFYQFSASNQ